MQLSLSQPLFPVVVSDVTERAQRLERFVAQHQARAVRMAYHLFGSDQAAAEDVAQEAFLRAHRGLASCRADAELST